jgi:hypothetical protein
MAVLGTSAYESSLASVEANLTEQEAKEHKPRLLSLSANGRIEEKYFRMLAMNGVRLSGR